MPQWRSTSAGGLARTRRAWVIERSGVEEDDGRPIAPIDNGNVKASTPQPFPNTQRPLGGQGGRPITRFEFARRGIVTREMIYVAARRAIIPTNINHIELEPMIIDRNRHETRE